MMPAVFGDLFCYFVIYLGMPFLLTPSFIYLFTYKYVYMFFSSFILCIYLSLTGDIYDSVCHLHILLIKARVIQNVDWFLTGLLQTGYN